MPESQPLKRRRYRLAPDRFPVGLMGAISFLWLSEQFCWFSFNEHKNWTVLIAMAVACAAVVLLLFWFGVSLISRIRFQFSIRSLLLIDTQVSDEGVKSFQKALPNCSVSPMTQKAN